MLTNPVVISIIVLLALSLLRINVVIAVIISALTAGVLADGFTLENIKATISTFISGLGGGAEVAMNYALLGAFAIAISRSGITDLLALKIIKLLGKAPTQRAVTGFKYLMFSVLGLFAISSQNILPIHIAFIPIVIPPLLGVFNQLKIDRRAIACILTFGLTATYMSLPIGFGKIFIEDILVGNINKVGAAYGLTTTTAEMSKAMLVPISGMVIGLLIAVFVTYRKPREYPNHPIHSNLEQLEQSTAKLNPYYICVCILGIAAAFAAQIAVGSIAMGGLAGLIVFALGGVFKLRESNDIFQQGLRLMAMIGFVMIAASGYAEVINKTNSVTDLVNSFSQSIGPDSKGLAALLMLLVGLWVTMGIGSSFSTVPIIASIYVPLCLALGFTPFQTLALVGASAALGDAGSPTSDSILGTTSGLNADGEHDHIWDTTIPTFIHFNIPLIISGWIAAMYF